MFWLCCWCVLGMLEGCLGSVWGVLWRFRGSVSTVLRLYIGCPKRSEKADAQRAGLAWGWLRGCLGCVGSELTVSFGCPRGLIGVCFGGLRGAFGLC